MPDLLEAKLPGRAGVSLRPYTTLKAGGNAELFAVARTVDELAHLSELAQRRILTTTILGSGSNMLPSDDGVPGLVILNNATNIEIDDGKLTADCGCTFQDLFLKTLQSGLRGLEFAVGIPGTLGGALVSNAGAYRSCVSEFLTDLEIVFEGRRQWVGPEWMEFSYRDSRLRKEEPVQCTVLRVKMAMPSGNTKDGYDEAREYQRQRISKQPPPASAGSFFKNVNDAALAQRLESLPGPLKKAGVVPAGYLIQEAGLMGFVQRGAMFSRRHANFIVNVGGATATSIRDLAGVAKREVAAKFGVAIEEEVLYLGDWSRYDERN